MRFLSSDIIRGFIRVALVAAAIIAPVLASTGISTGAQSGIAYDEMTKVIMNTAAPQPGNFPADFKNSVDSARAAANAPKHHGLFAKMYDMADMAKAEMAQMKNGTPSTHYFLNNWDRNDDPVHQTATIIRPDRKQIIHLDLLNKTYRIEDMTTTMPVMTESPPPNPGPPGPQPSPQPGTGKLDVTTSSTVLGPKTIDGVHTVGYNQDLKIVSTQSTGSCVDGNFETTITEYISDITPPLAKSNPTLKYHLSGHPPLMTGARPGCNPTTTTHHSGSVEPPSDHLNIWTLMTMKAGAQTNQGQMGGNFSMLTERGNVRDLGPGDAGLFDIPAGFTKQQ
jgi:hypothetical protein